MKRDEMLALAERVEALTRPCIATDAAITKALGLGPDVDYYTASLDAAMTLVPEGCAPGVYMRAADDWASMVFGPTWQTVADTRAKTAALALTAAALRAIAAQEDEA